MRSKRESFFGWRDTFFTLLFSFPFFLLTNCGRDPRGEMTTSLNRLAGADSPYLREHADNPVDWYEWGQEALQKASAENKPLIISVGYASCHWCHVMEEESFMDTAVARIMNENFVSIKIDREQRPDIDQIYLNAAQLISGNAGWPLNAFALPDGRPFYAATYFPKEQWIVLLRQVTEAYNKENTQVVQQAEAVTRGVESHELIISPPDSAGHVDQQSYVNIFDRWTPALDFEYGGLSGAPKFPLPVNWEFLLQYHALTGSEKALEHVVTTLDRMAAGGIYDRLAGGFFRYSTDGEWRVPHFEKMLYDNAQLASLYAHAYTLTKKPLYKRIVTETIAFVEKELMADDGAFYSSLNADSGGEEGAFYVWTKNEIIRALEGDAPALIIDYYNVTDSGNWEKAKNVLYATVRSDDFARQHALAEGEWERRLNKAHGRLLEARNKRTRPSTDDKVLTSWNALMMTACIDAYTATGGRHYLEMALKNAAFLEEKMVRPDGGLWRNYRDGKASIDGFLDDYAFLAQAFVQLYQVTFNIHWLETARAVTGFATEHFQDQKTGMFYYTSDRSEDLIVRKMGIADQEMPSSNSVMAGVLFTLGELYQKPSYTAQSKVMLNHILNSRDETETLFYANWLRQAGWFAFRPFEVAVLGADATSVSLQLRKNFLPLAIFAGGSEENLPLLENKYVEGRTMIYVCRNRVCRLPVEDVAKALGQLAVWPAIKPAESSEAEPVGAQSIP